MLFLFCSPTLCSDILVPPFLCFDSHLILPPVLFSRISFLRTFELVLVPDDSYSPNGSYVRSVLLFKSVYGSFQKF